MKFNCSKCNKQFNKKSLYLKHLNKAYPCYEMSEIETLEYELKRFKKYLDDDTKNDKLLVIGKFIQILYETLPADTKDKYRELIEDGVGEVMREIREDTKEKDVKSEEI